MKFPFTQEQKTLHQIVLHLDDVQAPGLLNGQTGIALTLAHYARIRHQRPIGYVSDVLIDRILNNLSCQAPLAFSTGLCGIGWAVEYLIQNHYMKGNSLDICAPINQELMNYSLNRVQDFSLERGMEGWLHYLLAHLQGTSMHGMPFPHEYLMEWHEASVRILQAPTACTPAFRELLFTLQQCLHGEAWRYDLSLSRFSIPGIKPDTPLLGIRKGLCGYMETHYLQAS